MKHNYLIAALFLSACQAQAPIIDAIYVNQHGFEPQSPKIAIAHAETDVAQEWTLLRGEEIISRGETVPLGHSARANQMLHRIDFTDIIKTGDAFTLRIGGIDSPEFSISTGLYDQMGKDAMAYFYHNRAGEPILAEHVGAAHARPAGHTGEVVTCFEGEDNWGSQWPGCNYELDVTGGWYDAGDHGKYVVNSGISVWTLLNAYERNPDVFPDGSLNIPEAGNGVPDILDEARKNIEFMLSMQVPEGETVWVAVGQQDANAPLKLTEIDAGGMVHHKVSGIKWPGDAVMPQENNIPRALYPPSTGATLNVAAIGAQCARIWRKIDAGFAERCETAMRNAFNASLSHKDVFAYNNFDGSGPYGDKSFDDEQSWSGMQMTQLHIPSRIVATPADKFTEFDSPFPASFNRTDMLASLSAMNYPPAEFEPSLIDAWETDFMLKAERILADIPDEPLYIPYASDRYTWGSNSGLANRAIILGTAYDLTGERKYRDGVVHIMDYFLGRNPLGQSYISGYGDQQFYNPHHRHWAPSIRDGAPTVPPGVLSGGPNNTNMTDPVAKNQLGTCAAQTCWTDDYYAWTQNEITINWNAPLVWMATFLADTD